MNAVNRRYFLTGTMGAAAAIGHATAAEKLGTPIESPLLGKIFR